MLSSCSILEENKQVYMYFRCYLTNTLRKSNLKAYFEMDIRKNQAILVSFM